ncbi:MAG TPA: cation diffusion facilitator family transporter [Bacteroidales bacterium]|nr:cation diffusion facilitator family transporter [Bacteroidales bacterium]HRZ48354.1 cation diffusion facilitator family transporter [Bacteroidales bacterium]
MDQRTRYGYLEGIISIVVNTLLFVIKYWAGIISGSIALIADAWHTLSDTISSVVLLFGIRLSSRKPDKEHPFGHRRWEQVTAILIGFILGIIAWSFLVASYERFMAREVAHFGTIAIVVTIISVVVKEGLAQLAFYYARKTSNVAIRADGWHHRSDALSSVVLLIGLMFRHQFWWIDSVAGAIIALMLFYTTFDIIRDAISNLLGEEPGEELIREITRIANETAGSDLQPHHFHIHNYGTHRELTFHIRVHPASDVKTAHCLATSVETSLKEQLHITSTIHIEPEGVPH